jgi:hypothetical protein
MMRSAAASEVAARLLFDEVQSLIWSANAPIHQQRQFPGSYHSESAIPHGKGIKEMGFGT